MARAIGTAVIFSVYCFVYGMHHDFIWGTHSASGAGIFGAVVGLISGWLESKEPRPGEGE